MDESNFGVDLTGKPCIFDFEAVGPLPESFATYSMRSTAFARLVAPYLDWPPCRQVHAMARISGILGMIYDATLSTLTHIQCGVLLNIGDRS